MKDLRLILPVFLLILIVLLFTGCKGITPAPPEPGLTDDDTTISGQILMPTICCLPLPEEKSLSKDNGNNAICNETEFWGEVPNAVVELKSAEKGKCNKILDTTFTDESGYYEFKDVKPGLYIITAYCPVEGNEDFMVKDVAEKISGQALDAGIPDCTSTGLALVIEKINNCYNDWYECFNKWTRIYSKVDTIAKDVGKVDIPAIMDHDNFGDYCDEDVYELVEMICDWDCCQAPGFTPPGPPPGITFTLILLVDPEGAGTTTGAGSFSSGITAPISASANEGWEFVSWTGDASGAVPGTSVLMNSNKTATANFVETIEPNPAISIDKVLTSAVPDPIELGSILTYTVTVTNTGDITLNNVTVSDPMLVPDNNSCPTLAVGADCVLVGTYTVTQTDIDDGEIKNTATGDSDETESVQDSLTVPIGQNPAIEVTKTADVDWATIGDTIYYDYLVENIGNVTLTNITANDDLLGSVFLDKSELAPGETTTGILPYTVTGNESNPLVNEVTVQGTAPDNSTVSDTDTESVEIIICGSCAKDDEGGCYTIESTAIYDPTDNTTTFWFRLCNSGTGPQCDVSHWVYGTETALEFCIDENDIVSITPDVETIGYDGSTGYYGIKWDAENQFNNANECHEYTIVLHGCRVDEINNYLAIIKDGSGFTVLEVCGPLCE